MPQNKIYSSSMGTLVAALAPTAVAVSVSNPVPPISFAGSNAGYNGSRGYTGSAGYAGSASTRPGYTGSVGSGYTGSASTVQGYTGSSGSGYAGSRGYTGSGGYLGSTGYTGSIGAGFTGSKGFVGSGGTGYAGSIGYAGSAGPTSIGAYTRTTLSSHAVLAANAGPTSMNITGYKGYILYKIQTNVAAWVRVYSSAAARTADINRSSTVDPSSDAGVLAEVITSGSQTVSFTPTVAGYNDESPVTTNIPMTVTNYSGVSSNVIVTLTLLQTET